MAARDRLDHARHDAAAERTSTLAGEYGSVLQYQRKMIAHIKTQRPLPSYWLISHSANLVAKHAKNSSWKAVAQ